MENTSKTFPIHMLQHRPPVQTEELLLDSAAARGMCRREGVGTIRHLSTKVLWQQQLVKRGVVTVGTCTAAEDRADLGTKPLPAHRLRQLRQWNGLVVDRNERLATGDREDGQDEDEQQGAAVQIISDPGQSDGGVLDALGNLVRAVRGTTDGQCSTASG